VPASTYFDQLTQKFQKEASRSAQMYAAVSEAIVQQSSGERPYVTNFDPYYGDTTQQGITIDKLQAITQFTSLWQTTNYDPKQAAGAYIASFSLGDTEYMGVAEASATSMVGGAYNIFPYAIPLAVLQFTQATHDPNFVAFAQRPEIRDWTGGHTFNREQDFLDFFRSIAIDKRLVGENGTLCTTLQDCTYDPRIPSYPSDPLAPYHSDLYNQFKGPEGRRWIWVYVQDRNQWVAADRDRNVATYVVMFNYTQDVIYAMDDGKFGPAYGLQLPLKYYLTYFNQFN
jgi:hypothetical protein